MTQKATASVPLAGFKYQPSLDGVRAIAVTLVIAAHLGIRPVEGGTVGVHIFFVLSGFLITTLLLDEQSRRGHFSVRLFYLRRALRLLPAMVLVVLVTDAYMALDWRNPVRSATLGSTPPVMFYYANWEWFVHGSTNTLGWFGHMWSLAVEEQFYLFWPLLLILISRRKPPVLKIVLALTGACLLSMTLRTWPLPGVKGNLFGTPMVGEMLLWGIIAAFLLQSSLADATIQWAARLQWPALAYLGLFIISAPMNLIGSQWRWGPGLTGVAISTVVIIIRVVTDRKAVIGRILRVRPLTFLGRISYGMYLWHILVCFGLGEWISFSHHTHPLYWVIGYGLTVLLAAASRRFVEAPLLRLKDSARMPPIRRSVAVVGK